MLFAAGVGIGMVFYAVTGPVVQYLYPPSGERSTADSAQDAVVWTMFHYGIAGWAVYALLGMALGCFAYRWGMPLSIRAALHPLLGKRVKGPLGDGISIIALVGHCLRRGDIDGHRRRLAFLAYSTESEVASVLTPPMPHPTIPQPVVPADADAVQDLEEKRD
jgi:hypothetical protein